MSVPFGGLSQGVLGRRKPGLAYRGRSHQRRRPTGGRLRFEPLEKRFLLSADLLSPGIADALSGGLNEIDAVIDDIVTNESLLDTPLPLITRTDVGATDVNTFSPTIRDLLAIDVDLDGSGAVEGATETALEAMDTGDGLGGSPDGRVDLMEAFTALFVSEISSELSGLSSGSLSTFTTFLENSLDDSLGPITLAVDNVASFDTDREVGFDLDLSLSFTTTLDLDLGAEAEALNLEFGSSIDIAAGLTFSVSFGVDLTDGSVDGGDFFVRPGALTVFASAGIPVLNISLDIGFLAADIINGSVSLTAEAEVTFDDPSNPAALGFDDSQRDVAESDGNITAANAPDSFVLDHDVIFSLEIGAGDAIEVLVTAASTTGNGSLTDLADDIDTALDESGLTGLVFAGDDGGNISLSLAATDPTPLGFSAEDFDGGGSLIGSVINDFTVASTFLLSVGGGQPRLITVAFDASRDTLAKLATALDDALTLAGSSASAAVDDKGTVNPTDNTLKITAGDTLEITNTLTFLATDNISFAELQNTSLVDLVSVSASSGSGASVTLPVTVSAGLAGLSGSGEILLNADPFATTTNSSGLADVALTLTGFGEFENFSRLKAGDVVGLLQQLESWFGELTDSAFFSQFDIPLISGALGDVLDFADMLSDALLYDDGDDGIGGDNADTPKLLENDNGSLVPRFNTAQDLATELASALGLSLSDIGARYDSVTDSLTYDIDLSHTFVDVDLPLDFSLDLAPIGDFSSSSTIRLSGDGGLTLSFGIFLGDGDAADELTAATTLASIGNGIGSNDALAVTGENSTLLELTGNATLIIAVNGGSGVSVIVASADTVGNGNIFDIAGNLNDALADAGLDGELEVLVTGTRLLIAAIDSAGVTGFTVSAAGSNPAVTELGFAASNTANSDDFVITTADGGVHGVDISSAVTIGDLIAAIADQSGGDVTATISDDGEGLVLTDNTSGSTLFMVASTNGSPAALQLGINLEDIVNSSETADGIIEGGQIGGTFLSDRFFVENAVVEGNITVSTPGGISALANFGFVGIELSGDGNLSASVTAGLTDVDGNLGGRVTLTDLFENLDDIGSIVQAPVVSGSGSFILDVSLNPSFSEIGLGTTPQLTIDVVDFGDPLADTPVGPTITVTTSGLDDLADFGDLSFGAIVEGLITVSDFLGQFEAFGFLNDPLPLINQSVNDLLGFAEEFANAVESVQDNPAGTLQLLEDALKQALGLPSDSTAIVLSLVSDSFGDALRIDLGLATDFSETLGINLDLGLPDFANLSGSAGLTASGALSIDLDFGINLADPSQVFLFDSTGIAGNLTVTGSDLAFMAGLGPLGLTITGGTASIAGIVSAGLDPTIFTDGRILIADISFGSDIVVSVSGPINVVLPAFFPTDTNFKGDITVSGDLTDPSNIVIVVPDGLLDIDLSEIGLFDSILLAVDGIDLFLGGLQDVLDGEVFGITLPLIGDSLADGARFIEDLRNGFVADFRTEVENFTDPNENIISELLFDLLGPSGIDLLLDSDGVAGITIGDIILLADDTSGAELFQWNFLLGQTLVDAGGDIGLDIGIPGLGLETEGSINLAIDWNLAFGFGLSRAEGFFFDISDGSELKINIDVTLPDVVITGKLGFLQIEATNNNNNTHLGVTFGINIINRSDVTDERLSFGELGNFGLVAGIAAEAIVDLGLVVALNSDLVPGATTVFPTIEADFFLEWSIGDRSNPNNIVLEPLSNIGNAVQDGLKLVQFTDVSLNAGEFLSQFLGPIVGEIQNITDPLQPIIDFITTPIPVISDLGPDVTLLDLAGTFGNVDARMISALRTVFQVISLINDIPTDGDLMLPFGDFVIFDESAGNIPDLTSSGADTSSFTLPSGNGQSLSSKLSTLESSNQSGANQTSSLLNKLTSGDASSIFALPILTDPSQIFGLLLGRTATLVTIDLPPLDLGFQFQRVFPLPPFPPLQAFIRGSVNFHIDLAFGFDTSGIQQFVDSGFRNPELIFDGFFISDTEEPDGSGADVPEVVFSASLTAGAQLNFAVAKAGVEGGIFITVNFDLFDPNQDGKVRISELIGIFEAQIRFSDSPALAPLAIFDVSGEIFVRLFAFYEIDLFLFQISDEFDIVPPTTILEFNIDFDRPTILATELPGGVLQLNMGEFAGQRLNGNVIDGNENFTVVQDDATHVLVSSSSLGISAQRYFVSSSIIALGGEGNDTIDLSGVTNAAITFELDGGVGNDIIRAGVGAAVIRGGAGDDELTGGDGADLIFGNAGNDTLNGGGGADVIFGDEGEVTAVLLRGIVGFGDGNDIINGGSGVDILFGGGGSDTIHGNAGNDTIIGDGARVQLSGATITAILDADRDILGVADTLFGDGNDDVIYGGRGGDVISGGSGADSIFGGRGEDSIDGDGGNDTIHGGDDIDTINGGADNDTIFGDGGGDVIHGDGGVDTIHGGVGSDQIFGDGGNDFLFGDSGGDIIHGGDNNDFIDGGAASDTIFGDAGDDTIRIGLGADTVDGGDDNDTINVVRVDGNTVITGGSGDDTVNVGSLAPGLAGGDVSEIFANILFNGEGGNDTLNVDVTAQTLAAAGLLTSTRLSGLTLPDGITYAALEQVNVFLGSGGDTITIQSTHAGGTRFEGNGGADIFDVQTISGDTVLNTGGGADTVNVGSLAPSTASGTVDGIAALLTVDGGTQNSIDQLNIDDTADTTDNFGTLTSSTITGLGTGGINYTGFEDLNIRLGSGNDTFNIQSTHAGTTLIETRLGDDTVNVRGADSRLDLINGALTISAGGGTDQINFDDSADQDANSGVLTSSTLTGLDMAVGVTYTGFEDLNITLGKGNDVLDVLSTHLGTNQLDTGGGNDTVNIETIVGVTTVTLSADDDTVNVNPDLTSPSTANGIQAVLNLDGQSGSDTYNINLAGNGASLINVFDSGLFVIDSNGDVIADGADLLVINGTQVADNFLLRNSALLDGPGFVALLNDFDLVERVNYDSNINQGLIVNSFAGNDVFTIDDNAATTTINGGIGNDRFQVGQLFRSERNTDAAIAGEDVFATIETTRGFLTNGISLPMTINGDAGEDEFFVFHNKAVLTLSGGDDDDNFIIRAFALAGSQEDTRERTDLSGDGGADSIQYSVNAPVNIFGGDGFDTVTVIGTEFGDDFVITKDGVFGAGLFVQLTGIESLNVDGAEGDDRFFVLSTNPDLQTVITGGLGSDTFNIAGDTPPVISNDLLGHSGIIIHSVESLDSAYDGLSVEGISANVADNDEPAIVVIESDGSTTISENGLEDSYFIVLTRAPTVGQPVFVTVTAPRPTPEEEAKGFDTFTVLGPDIVGIGETPATIGESADIDITPSGGPSGFGTTPATITPNNDFVVQSGDFFFGTVPVFIDADGTIGGANIVGRSDFGIAPTSLVGNDGDARVAINAEIGTVASGTNGIFGSNEFNREIGFSDIDFYRFELRAGERLTLDIDFGQNSGNSVDTQLHLFNQFGQLIASNDDSSTANGGGGSVHGFDSFLAFNIDTSGFYYAAVTSYNNDGFSGGFFNHAGFSVGTYTLQASITPEPIDPVILDANGTIETAEVIERLDFGFAANANIADDSLPHVVIEGSIGGVGATNDVDFYQFDLRAGERFSLDIDSTTNGLDTQIALFDSIGNLLASNNNASTSLGGGGSTSGLDSFLSFDIDTNGTYFVAVSSFFNTATGGDDFTGVGLTSGDYTLNAVINPLPGPATVLTFTSDNWDIPQEVRLFATDDGGFEGPTVGVINHSVQSGDTITGTATSAVLDTITGLTTLFDTGASFVTDGSLIGGTVEIVGGTGVGQSSIITANTATSLELGRAFATPLDATSEYAIIRFDGLAIPSVFVNLIDNDSAGVTITQSAGSTDVIEGGAGDSFDVTLTHAPTASVFVTLDSDGQITVDGAGSTVLEFTPGNFDIVQTVTIAAVDDGAVEGFQVSAIATSVSSADGDFDGLELNPILVNVSDNDSPGVLITQTGGSTDVIEGANTDTYSVVLTAAPSDTVTVNVTPEQTRATRGPLASFELQVSVDKPVLTFTTTDWFIPQIVTVTAIDDGFVDGGDTKQFAPILDVVTGIQGPLVIDGASGGGSSEGLGGDPVVLPGETNIALSDGTVQAVASDGSTITVLSSDVAEFDLLDLGIQISEGQAIDEFRLIDNITIDGIFTVLTLNLPWDTDGTPDTSSKFAITNINPSFFAIESEQVDTLTVNHTDSVNSDVGRLTATTLTGLGMGGDTLIGDTLVPGGITYGNIENLTINLGSGNDSLVVDGTQKRDDFRTVTVLNTGLGNDDVTVNLTDGVDGLFALNTEGGDDIIDASASSLPLVLFGGAGNDTIDGGSGADIIFGDRGRVDYFDGANSIENLVTRFGPGGGGEILSTPVTDTDVPADQTNGLFLTPDLFITVDLNVGGIDVINGNGGDDTIFGGAAADIIRGNSGNDTILGDHGVIDLIDGLVVSIRTTDTSATSGGADDIEGNADDDLILAGSGGDHVLGNGGADIILGDQGRILLTGGLVARVSSLDDDATAGGGDTIFGNAGNDVIIAGIAGDTIEGNAGDDVILGDNGAIDYDLDSDLSTIDRIEAIDITLDSATASGDVISGNGGSDIILGGADGDEIHGDAAAAGSTDLADIILGDNGVITLVGGAVATITTTDSATTKGGRDTITGNAGGDVILGGKDGDDIQGNGGGDVILGDAGNLDYGVDGAGLGTLDLIQSTQLGFGGDDTISGNAGADIIIAGAAGDTVSGDGGDDVILGDNGAVTLDGGAISLIRSTDTTQATGGDDGITGNADNDIIIGGVNRDTIAGNGGSDIILGDNGLLDYGIDGAGLATLDLIQSTDLGLGDDDNISGNAGNDIIIAGAANDTVAGQAGDDIILGDSGELTLDNGAITLIRTTDTVAATGGDDGITGGADNDIIFGGVNRDTIGDSGGNNVVLGDNGSIDYVSIDGDPTDIDVISSILPALGDVDSITTAGGDDIVIGGAAGDTIDVGDGDNIVIGDSGLITASDATDDPTLSGHPLTIGRIETIASAIGGADTIDTGIGRDLVLGGADGDTITVSEGNNIVIGDNGFIDFVTDDNDPADIDQIGSIDPGIGGVDIISSGAGDDIVIGGAEGDTIDASDGDNIVIGDSGLITAFNGPGTFTLAGHPMIIDTIASIAPGIGGDDSITTGADNDIVIGGAGNDSITTTGASVLSGFTLLSSNDDDIVLGDNGLLDFETGDGDASTLDLITTSDPTQGGDDTIITGADNDWVFGGTGADLIFGGAGNDLIFGDHGMILPQQTLPIAGGVQSRNFFAIDMTVADLGGDDVIFGGAGDDILLGQQGDDALFGGDDDDDLIGGHNVAGGIDELSAASAAGANDVLDGGAGFDVLAGDNAEIWRQPGSSTSPRFQLVDGTLMYNTDGSAAIQNIDQQDPDADNSANAIGRDITILDHTAAIAAGTGANPWGNDLLAGGAGNDMLFGGLGNDVLDGDGVIDPDTLILDTTEAASDGDDYIEGNGGDDLIYGGLGQDDLIGGSSSLFGIDNGVDRPDGSDTIFGGDGNRIARNQFDSDLDHARDSDMILGDNGNIFRLVQANGSGGTSYLTFNYDAARGLETIVPRAVDLIDYNPDNSGAGAADIIRGESGDDFIHGESGDDIIYGDSGDDDLFGEAGDDWISGGTGEDGILGDDGKIFTSRNGIDEPLHGVAATIQWIVSGNGQFGSADLNVAGELKKSVDLEPYDVGGDDMIYGGLGDDWLHGGAGNDGLSGAEALSAFYDNAAATPHVTVDPLTGRIDTGVEGFYDADNALAKIAGHALNFDAAEQDGDDRIFGDLGEDWLVGGVGNDHMYGGLGNDILNADDNLETNGGLNDVADANSGRDIAFGGGGRDMLIGNSGADRLIDWLGEFDNFVVPFKPFGASTINRAPTPALVEFLFALAESDGSDQTRIGTNFSESDSEIGLVTSSDPLWSEQHGAPDGAQPGNGNGKKDTR